MGFLQGLATVGNTMAYEQQQQAKQAALQAQLTANAMNQGQLQQQQAGQQAQGQAYDIKSAMLGQQPTPPQMQQVPQPGATPMPASDPSNPSPINPAPNPPPVQSAPIGQPMPPAPPQMQQVPMPGAMPVPGKGMVPLPQVPPGGMTSGSEDLDNKLSAQVPMGQAQAPQQQPPAQQQQPPAQVQGQGQGQLPPGFTPDMAQNIKHVMTGPNQAAAYEFIQQINKTMPDAPSYQKAMVLNALQEDLNKQVDAAYKQAQTSLMNYKVAEGLPDYDAVKQAYGDYKAGDPQALRNLGTAEVKRVQAMAEHDGFTGEMRADAQQRFVAQRAEGSAEGRTTGNKTAQVDVSINELRKVAPDLLDLAQKVLPADAGMLSAGAQNYYKKITNDPQYREFKTQLDVAINQYGRSIGASLGAVQKAQKALDSDFSDYPTFKAALQQALTALDQEKTANKESVQSVGQQSDAPHLSGSSSAGLPPLPPGFKVVQ